MCNEQKQITLSHCQQIAKAQVSGERDLTKPITAWQCSSWKAFQHRQIFQHVSERNSPSFGERDYSEATVWFERHYSVTKQGEWPEINGYQGRHVKADGAGSFTHASGQNSALWTSLCLFAGCYILCVCTCGTAPRKLCLFALLVKKNTRFSRVLSECIPFGEH